ncbi:sulfite exporter TauE/SafE family protein [Pseudomonas sp. SLFW]|uniref:sulfite exporter TauE/SafE family protein n=1 Tax=Pseudomonas sp. SLFW TaxID=2683259 RepID=UPI00141344BF|nr:sulfite exporter TauE/SafE family protein [Pseudomonas sp. SLFW]NBB12111.1 TSUP family transporter [Pseudomonas sp. SLFW]
MTYLLLALFGALSGVTTVLFGFGGGFVVVPVLYGILNSETVGGLSAPIAMHVAVATSTCVMIVNASLSTRRSACSGTLLKDWLWPLAGFIGIGSLIGAVAAGFVNGSVLRVAFMAYLAITIADCLLRRGFVSRAAENEPRPLSAMTRGPGGILIGAIATFLGVGGSVMTVPLLRRCGLSMTQATAMANPLSLPVALFGTTTYMVTGALDNTRLGAGYIGYVNLIAFALLTLGAWFGMGLAARWVGRIPDRLHAWAYVGLLGVVLVSMGLT